MTVPVVVTCEHATATVPPGYGGFFKASPEVLETHRAYDPGARDIARALARRIGAESPVEAAWTRLLVDSNRSLENRAAFSEFSPPPGDPLRAGLRRMHQSHRARVTRRLERNLMEYPEVIHLSIHTFTPCLDGVTRVAQIGLLYDPSRLAERELCRAIRETLAESRGVRMNYPYRGTSDGLTRDLRARLGPRYLGIELELNHGTFFSNPASWKELKTRVIESVAEVIARRYR